MMFPTSGHLLFDQAGREAWNDLMHRLRLLQKLAGPEDPWVFHGTSQKRALDIAKNGFSLSWVPTRAKSGGGDGPSHGVYWTDTLWMATKFAMNKASVEDGFPVILRARLSEVVAAGLPVPDRLTWQCDTDEDPKLEPTDWRDSLTRLNAFCILGRHEHDRLRVANLRLDAALPLDTWPDPQVSTVILEDWIAGGPPPAMLGIIDHPERDIPMP